MSPASNRLAWASVSGDWLPTAARERASPNMETLFKPLVIVMFANVLLDKAGNTTKSRFVILHLLVGGVTKCL